MTTIDIAAAPALVPATRLRLTTRGRRVVALLASLPAIAALSIAIVSGGGALASAERGAPVDGFATVTVLPGDSLWSIAQEVAPAADPRDVIDAIVRLNALGSAQLDAGTELAIPAEYATLD